METNRSIEVPAITLQEPYGSLMVWGLKAIETRSGSFQCAVRGVCAIHVSKRWQPIYRVDAESDPHIVAALRSIGVTVQDMEKWCGHVLGTVEIVRVYRMNPEVPAPPAPERHFGNYQNGRVGVVCTNPRRLVKPIPAKGSLGVWRLRVLEELWKFADGGAAPAPRPQEPQPEPAPQRVVPDDSQLGLF